MVKKYWIGSSDEFDHKPVTFETYLVFNEDELQDAQAEVAEWMAEDFIGDEDDEGNESTEY